VISWNDIFSYIAPLLIKPSNAEGFRYLIDAHLINKKEKHTQYNKIYLENNDAQTIKIQFMALNLINSYPANAFNGGVAEFVQLTAKGLKYLQEIKTVKTVKI